MSTTVRTADPTAAANPLGLEGIDFVEITTPDPVHLATLLRDLGFSRLMRHRTRAIDLWRQHDISVVVNLAPDSAAARFQAAHGPSISALGWRVRGAHAAAESARARGATIARGDHQRNGEAVPAIEGIGGMLLYMIDDRGDARWERMGFAPLPAPERVPDRGFLAIDHLTNNVARGTMAPLVAFYQDVFGFTEVRTFDIRGKKTGLKSFALRSPCGTFCIPINEGNEDASQIDEYLRAYRDPGVQHLAFLTDDIVSSLTAMRGSSVRMLDIDPSYYDTVFERVPGVSEDRATLRDLQILVDGDAQGYLLQIFTQNLLGPVFIEIIQRKNHLSFGEGNFGALFRTLERDQEARGTI